MASERPFIALRVGPAQLAIKPAQRVRLKRVGRNLGRVNEPALGTLQGPMLKPQPPGNDALNCHAGLALRTARSLDFAWR